MMCGRQFIVVHQHDDGGRIMVPVDAITSVSDYGENEFARLYYIDASGTAILVETSERYWQIADAIEESAKHGVGMYGSAQDWENE